MNYGECVFKVCVVVALFALMINAMFQAHINHTQFKINQAAIEGRNIQLQINDRLLGTKFYRKVSNGK